MPTTNLDADLIVAFHVIDKSYKVYFFKFKRKHVTFVPFFYLTSNFLTRDIVLTIFSSWNPLFYF